MTVYEREQELKRKKEITEGVICSILSIVILICNIFHITPGVETPIRMVITGIISYGLIFYFFLALLACSLLVDKK